MVIAFCITFLQVKKISFETAEDVQEASIGEERPSEGLHDLGLSA